MKYLKLTSDFKFFSIKWENKILYFDWIVKFNLSDVKTISLSGFQIFPLTTHNKGYAIRVFTNLIRVHNSNPMNEIADFYIPKHSEAIPKYSESGES